jgi:mRNA interferase MazF
MTKLSVICDLWQVAAVQFPFTEAPGAKRRPALALTQPSFNQEGHTVFAMITSRLHRPWPGDAPIRDLGPAGLSRTSIVRLKLFTLDNRLILHTLGQLSARDREAVSLHLGTFFASIGTPDDASRDPC